MKQSIQKANTALALATRELSKAQYDLKAAEAEVTRVQAWNAGEAGTLPFASASQSNPWELFAGEDGCANANLWITHWFLRVCRELNNGTDAYKVMDRVLDRFSEFGATDTEPRNHLLTRLEAHFGETIDPWAAH